jgi:hypothetical protein
MSLIPFWRATLALALEYYAMCNGKIIDNNFLILEMCTYHIEPFASNFSTKNQLKFCTF